MHGHGDVGVIGRQLEVVHVRDRVPFVDREIDHARGIGFADHRQHAGVEHVQLGVFLRFRLVEDLEAQVVSLLRVAPGQGSPQVRRLLHQPGIREDPDVGCGSGVEVGSLQEMDIEDGAQVVLPDPPERPVERRDLGLVEGAIGLQPDPRIDGKPDVVEAVGGDPRHVFRGEPRGGVGHRAFILRQPVIDVHAAHERGGALTGRGGSRRGAPHGAQRKSEDGQGERGRQRADQD